MRGFLGAVSLLTRIPARGDAEGKTTVPWLPVVGALIGGVCALVYVAARTVLSPLASAILAVAAGILLTGALHEDGLADTADAFGAGVDRERTLEILKDPHHGTYGVLAIVVSVVARIAGVAGMAPWAAVAALPAAHALGRAAPALLMWLLPAASDDGLGARYSERLGRRRAGVAALLGVGAAIALLGAWGVVAAAIAGALTAIVGSFAMRRIGGITGDVLGAVEQLVEIGVLLLAAAVGASIPWWRG